MGNLPPSRYPIERKIFLNLFLWEMATAENIQIGSGPNLKFRFSMSDGLIEFSSRNQKNR